MCTWLGVAAGKHVAVIVGAAGVNQMQYLKVTTASRTEAAKYEA